MKLNRYVIIAIAVVLTVIAFFAVTKNEERRYCEQLTFEACYEDSRCKVIGSCPVCANLAKCVEKDFSWD